jgi:hypothetical protein
MAKIPVSTTPGMIGHVSDTVNMSGAPGIDWNTGTARALANIGANLGNLAKTTLDFLQQEQDVEDELAAAEARNLYNSINNETRKRMAESPDSVADFGEWTRQADQRYNDEVAPILGKMSANYRAKFEKIMEGRRAEVISERELMTIQAGVTSQLKQHEALYTAAAAAGDIAGANKQIARMQELNLLSAEQAEIMRSNVERIAAEGEARRQVERDPGKMAAQLRERKDDSYVNFGNISENYRLQLIRFAEAEQDRREADSRQAYLAQVVTTGKFDSIEQIKADYEAGKIDHKTVIFRTKIAEEQARHIRSAQRQQRSDADALRKLKVDNFAAQIALMDYPAPQDMQRFRKDIMARAAKQFPGNVTAQKKIADALEEKLKNDPLDKLEIGRELKKKILADIKIFGEENDEIPDADIVEMKLNMLHAARQMVNDPKIKYADAAKKLDEIKALAAEKKISEIWSPATGELRVDTYGKVFDSKEKTVREAVPGLYGRSFWRKRNMTPDEIEAKKKQGFIDLADIVEKRTVKDSQGRPREMWKMRDGRLLYADQYQ